MPSKNNDSLNIPEKFRGPEYEKELEREQEFVKEQELRAAKLKKKMIIFGIILLVLIAAYIALEIYSRSAV